MPPEFTINIGFYIVFLLSVTAHEAAHAWAGWKLGDDTAYLGGQVTLDPLPHIRREPIGMVVVPIVALMYIGFPIGYASAPYNPLWAQRLSQARGVDGARGARCQLDSGSARARPCAHRTRDRGVRESRNGQVHEPRRQYGDVRVELRLAVSQPARVHEHPPARVQSDSVSTARRERSATAVLASVGN